LVVLDIAASRDNNPRFSKPFAASPSNSPSLSPRAAAFARSRMRAPSCVPARDKITVNTAAVQRPELIGELSCEFGAQAVVLAIDARRENEGWVVRVRGGRAATGLDAEEWALRGVELGAGEILLTSMDRDGTQSGFDIALTAAISRAVSVPLIASGGAKIPQHFLEIFTQGSADAALAASIFHDQVQSIRALKSYLKETAWRCACHADSLH